MKKPLTAIAVLMAAITLIGADAPCLIPFQGRLTNQQGIAYTEGQYTLIFNLYDTAVGGTSLWTERHEKVGVINGMVNLFLGSINSLDGQDFSKTRYLGITVDADGNANSYDPEMIPRQMIIPSFHAQNSSRLQGMDWSAVLSGDKTIPIASRYINPDRIHDGTITYEKLDPSVADKLLPAGMIQPFAGPTNNVPAGWLPCDGRTVDAGDYPKLYAAIGNSWGGSGNSFKLPDLRGKTLWGANGDNAVGTTLAAGLPNITGSLMYMSSKNAAYDATTGALSWQHKQDAPTGAESSGWAMRNLLLDASRSSAIYGSSDTVQPPAGVVNFIIKY